MLGGRSHQGSGEANMSSTESKPAVACRVAVAAAAGRDPPHHDGASVASGTAATGGALQHTDGGSDDAFDVATRGLALAQASPTPGGTQARALVGPETKASDVCRADQDVAITLVEQVRGVVRAHNIDGDCQ